MFTLRCENILQWNAILLNYLKSTSIPKNVMCAGHACIKLSIKVLKINKSIVLSIVLLYCHCLQYFSDIAAVSFIGGGNRNTRRNHRPATSYWQSLSPNVVILALSGIRNSQPRYRWNIVDSGAKQQKPS
jgi:hypothetical protein